MAEFGRILIGLGVVIALVGAALTLWPSLGLPRLPGDLVVRRGNTTLFLPLATSILVSVVLSLILNLLFRRKP